MEHALEAILASLNTPEIQYVVLIFCLFVMPRFFIRLGIPFALTSFIFGISSTAMGMSFAHDSTIELLSLLGIVSLFLFAGLEVEISELRKSKKILIEHTLIKTIMLGLSSFALITFLALDGRQAAILALAILTPSTGFILDSLDNSKMSDETKFWIRSKAIGTEIVALAIMFVVVRSLSVEEFAYSSAGLILLILVMPPIFKFFANFVVPAAPKSEFGFLLMMAILAGMVTKKLGAYYLIGAFIVGIVANRFKRAMPQLVSKTMLKSIKQFTGFFTPFYFFKAGAGIDLNIFTMEAILLGLTFLAIFVPLRIFSIFLHRRIVLKEKGYESFPIATSLLPNLVFGLVLANILKNIFHIDTVIFGALIIYTVGTTLLPLFLLKFFFKKPDYMLLDESSIVD